MEQLFAPALFDRLRMLARAFVWNRKSLHNIVAEELRTAGAAHTSLASQHQQTLDRQHTLMQEYAQLSERFSATTTDLAKMCQAAETLELALNGANAKHMCAHGAWAQARQVLEETATVLKAELWEKASENIALQQAADLQHTTHQGLQKQFESLQTHHGDTWTRFQLVSRLLAAQPPQNAARVRFSKLVGEYEAAVAQSASWPTADTSLVASLKLIDRELDMQLGFPELSGRTIAGVVGGFNSGKSEFINSFILDRAVRLAIGVKPVTAVPSYVTARDGSVIRGFTPNGGHVDLDADGFKRMSHAFLKTFDFDLKRLMPFMCVGTPMDPAYFSALCLLDTPGYNPPATASAYSQHDRRTAVQAAQQSDAILWLIGLDVNGTVPASDLDFIRDIGLDGRNVYVVLNKADLKPQAEIESIMDEVREVLDQEGLPVAGISAYSSTQREVLHHHGPSLLSFLAQFNRNSQARQHVAQRLISAFKIYEKTLREQIAAIQSQKRCINDLQLDALEFGSEAVYHKILNRLSQLDLMLSITPLEKALEEARLLSSALSIALLEALKPAA
jgi:ribosome biogenesis GTPase A